MGHGSVVLVGVNPSRDSKADNRHRIVVGGDEIRNKPHPGEAPKLGIHLDPLWLQKSGNTR